MEKLIITVTCDSTMSYPSNPYNPKGVKNQAEEYIRSVNAGASICHLHGPYTVDEQIQADGTKLSDLDIPGWANLKELIEDKCDPIIQYGIANGRFPQRKELMKQNPDMMSICFNAHDECFDYEPGNPPVELYGIHDRDELTEYCQVTSEYNVKVEVEAFHYGGIWNAVAQIPGIDDFAQNRCRHFHAGQWIIHLWQAVDPNLVIKGFERRYDILALPFRGQQARLIHHVAQSKDQRNAALLQHNQGIGNFAAKPQGLFIDNHDVGVEHIGGMLNYRSAQLHGVFDIKM